MPGAGLKTIWAAVLLLSAVTLCHSQTSDCAEARSCDLCVGDSTLNLTGCAWRTCSNDRPNDTGCVSDQDDFQSCNATNDAAMCIVVESASEGDGDSDSDSDGSSQFSQARFDMSSFLGGVILVLCLQAAGFFALRFLRTKDSSTYDPIEQPQ